MSLRALRRPVPAASTVLIALPGLGGTGFSFPPAAFAPLRDVTVFFADYGNAVDSVPAMAHAIWMAVLAAGIDCAVVLLGYSMGGFVAQSMYLQAPSRVAGLVFLSTTCLSLEDVVCSLLGGAHGDTLNTFVAKGRRPRHVPAGGIVSPAIFAREVAAVLAHVTANDCRFMRTVTDCPVLSVYGSADTVVSVASMEKLRALADVTPFEEHVFAGAGHDLIYEQPAAFAALLQAWIDANAFPACGPYAHEDG
jgi:pimeloyl-ACP methyl ester carboxylesterase